MITFGDWESDGFRSRALKILDGPCNFKLFHKKTNMVKHKVQLYQNNDKKLSMSQLDFQYEVGSSKRP